MEKIDFDKVEVIHNIQDERFEIPLGDHLAILEYQLSGGSVIFTHTEVPEQYEGHGLASKLAFTALEYAKEQGLQVVSLCPFVSVYIRRHPEYQRITTVLGKK